MTRRSLRLRLLLVSTASIFLALFLAGLVLVALFERHVERRVEDELGNHIRQIAAYLRVTEDGELTLTVDPPDPRFRRPLSGLYWQVQDPEKRVWLRSRSLWDYRLPLPDDKPALGVVRRLDVPGPDRSTVVVLEQALVYDTPMGLQTRRITAAMDRAEIDRAVAAYSADLWTALTALGLILSLAAAVQVWFGLRPLESVRRGIGAIRRQSQRRLTGPFPDEIMPLVVEVNGLLDAQDELVAKARNRAADLAHGLKTPLTVIANDARKLRGRGEEEIAEELEALVRSMRRHVDHELARARVAADTARREASTDLVTVTSGIIATLRRTPQGGGLEWIARMPETMPVALDENDLSEVVGNLLENASKWAERGIEVDLSRVGSVVRLSVADDGSGVSDALIDALGQRGLRLDRQTPGTGMGLAIVREIVAAYDGELSYENRVEGGFRVTVDLPTAESM